MELEGGKSVDEVVPLIQVFPEGSKAI